MSNATPIEIPTVESSYAGETGHFKSDHVLHLRGTFKRFGVCGWVAGARGRIECGGPMIEGPYACTYGLASVMTANPAHGTAAERVRRLAEGTEHDVAEGDLLLIAGTVYRIRILRREYLELDKVG